MEPNSRDEERLGASIIKNLYRAKQEGKYNRVRSITRRGREGGKGEPSTAMLRRPSCGSRGREEGRWRRREGREAEEEPKRRWS